MHRSHALEPLLKPVVVVPEDVIIYGPVKLINTGEVLAVVHFGLQMTEEVLHHRVGVAVDLTRYRLHTTNRLN
ncbi:hypothetical protein FRC0456_02289 [Corynebacterium diphtheriae]|nr:hypothetical protein CIP107545_00132 [Corynebacterium diphtheriae]CAB0621912.1 hypothetical protein CIP107535_02196 [Corynebacterium diphtheriae]CAB0665319.1 hypothetical protein CIP107565_02086 [Corynebacterium diphtheriae]CAB0730596.1 hypothetical protein FRC0104_00131 [Corynebacterium diphtheriae]CAB0864445.1 hypothetical protein FRC0322_02173 [Corynebacterium diphtheriae]